MEKTTKTILITSIGLIIIFAVVYFGLGIGKGGSSGVSKEEISKINTYTYGHTYTNAKYGFSFRHPENFTVTEIPLEGSTAVIVQDVTNSIGVQIVITETGESDVDITADMVKAELPNVKVADEQEVNIGVGRKGVAFVSNNEQFGGDSREVWFFFRGNMYQISTYAELDKYLQGIFATWEFSSQYPVPSTQ